MTDDGYFDSSIAQNYDADHGATDPTLLAQCVGFLRGLAGDGPALEFAVGTGRVALPLAATGVTVKGIELSAAMVREMRTKPGGTEIETVIGDMCKARMEGAFSLVYLVFNTIDNLTTQAAQVECFRNAARHLRTGGRFLIETQVPPIRKLPLGESRRVFARSHNHWGIEEVDIATQSHVSHHVWLEEGNMRTLSIPFRYAWPAEMDLMAELAGLRLEARYADWERGTFTSESQSHISIWRK